MKLKIIQNQQTPKIETFTDSITPFESIQKFIKQERKLLEKFLWFSQKQFNCAGLAANQVAIDGKRIMEPFFTIKNTETRLHFWEIIIHPTIIKYIGKPETKNEGCLTWIGKDIIAERYPEIDVSYYNLIGRCKVHLSGFYAQVFQHEYNHLMGVEENVVERVKI